MYTHTFIHSHIIYTYTRILSSLVLHFFPFQSVGNKYEREKGGARCYHFCGLFSSSSDSQRAIYERGGRRCALYYARYAGHLVERERKKEKKREREGGERERTWEKKSQGMRSERRENSREKREDDGKRHSKRKGVRHSRISDGESGCEKGKGREIRLTAREWEWRERRFHYWSSRLRMLIMPPSPACTLPPHLLFQLASTPHPQPLWHRAGNIDSDTPELVSIIRPFRAFAFFRIIPNILPCHPHFPAARGLRPVASVSILLPIP